MLVGAAAEGPGPAAAREEETEPNGRVRLAAAVPRMRASDTFLRRPRATGGTGPAAARLTGPGGRRPLPLRGDPRTVNSQVQLHLR